MSGRSARSFLVFVLVLLSLSFSSEITAAKDLSSTMPFASPGSKKTQDKADKALPEIPANLDQAKINEIVAGLSDDQVRWCACRKKPVSGNTAPGVNLKKPLPLLRTKSCFPVPPQLQSLRP